MGIIQSALYSMEDMLQSIVHFLAHILRLPCYVFRAIVFSWVLEENTISVAFLILAYKQISPESSCP